LSAHAEGVLQQVQPIELVQFLREDERALIQVGQHLLVINQLKPYPTWEQFSELIQQGFEAYCIASKPKAIQRIVLRYINKIDIPTEEIQLEDYFQLFPYVGPNFPDTFGAFIAGVQIPYDAGDDVLRVQLSNATEQATGALSAVLDLEYVFSSPGSLPITDNINRVQLAHERLETIFEACITDSLRNLFGEES
jgi:uncharacterized protein (TIGR04255 family)